MPKRRHPPLDDSERSPVIKDVARHAGVSTATVSRVFSAPERVRSETRERVIEAANAVGFVANGAARALTTRRNMTVGAVIPNIENEGFLKLISTFQSTMHESGYTILIASAGYDVDKEMDEATLLLERGIDGLLLAGDIHRPELIARLASRRVHLVQVFSLSKQRACVGFDNAEASMTAANHLMDLGHRRIGVIMGIRENNDRAGERVRGVRQALAARSLTMLSQHDVSVSHGILAGREGMRRILEAKAARPTAVICGTDQMAFGAIIEARSHGLNVPEDLSVIGFNDSDYAPFITPALTTVRIHSSEIGRAAAGNLIARMTGQLAPQVIRIEPLLIVRESTAPPPTKRSSTKA